MTIKQTIWSLDKKRELLSSSLINENELEELLATNIDLLSNEWLLIGRQIHTSYNGKIDLLCIDVGGNPVVIELKRNMTPREVTAQALDYASWVKGLDAEEMAQIFLKNTDNKTSLDDAYKKRFGRVLDTDNDDIDVKIVIVAADADDSTERIINYLKSYGIDICVLTFSVFEYEGERFLSYARTFEKIDERLSDNKSTWNGEYYFSFGVDRQRSWDDAIKYKFLSAGGGPWYTITLNNLEPGKRVWVNIPHIGYVGVGMVRELSVSSREATFAIDDRCIPFFDLELQGEYHKNQPIEKDERLVKVDWIKTVPQNEAISEYGFFGNQNTVCRPRTNKWEFTVERTAVPSLVE